MRSRWRRSREALLQRAVQSLALGGTEAAPRRRLTRALLPLTSTMTTQPMPANGRTAAPAHRTKFSLPGGAAPTALEHDEWTVPRDCPAIAALPFLNWVTPAAPAAVRVKVNEVMGVALAAITFDLADTATRPALLRANLIEHSLTLDAVSSVFHELDEAGIFKAVHVKEAAFHAALEGCSILDATALSFKASWLADDDPFDTHAPGAAIGGRTRRAAPVDAVPAANPGPPNLLYLKLASWMLILGEAERSMPGRASYVLARLYSLMSSKMRDSTRRDASSDVQALADTLAQYVGTWAGLGTSPSAPQLSRKLVPYLSAALSALPAEIMSPGGSASFCELDLRDANVILTGRDSEAAAVYWSRIHMHLGSFDVLGKFQGKTRNSGDTRALLERLLVSMGISDGNPYVRVLELARELSRRGKAIFVRDLFAAGSSAGDVVEELQDSFSNTAGTATVPDSGGAATGVAGQPGVVSTATGGAMGQHEFDRAVSEANFQEAMHEMGKDTEGLAQLEAAATSGSVLILRFLFFAPAWMRPRHVLFDTLGKLLPDRADYLSQSVVVDANSDAVPQKMQTYKIGDALSAKFWNLEWHDMDMVNANKDSPSEGGFLAKRHLEHGTVYKVVPKHEHYTVESTVLGIRDFFNRLLLSVSFAAAISDDSDGYTWFDVCDQQLEVIRYIGGLPESERAGWSTWADKNFREHGLARAATILRGKLNTARPAEELISWFLPPGAAFFSNINTKLKDAEPIAVIRRAFPTYFPSAPVALAGTSASHGEEGHPDEGNGNGQGGGKGKGKKRDDKPDAPGSKSHLSKFLEDGNLFHTGRIIDVDGVCKELKVDAAKICLPVLFSSKQGAAALALCHDPKKHGDINSSFHKKPKGFKRDKLLEKFSTSATQDQLKEVGWRQSKKAKKN